MHALQSFITDGYLILRPDLPSALLDAIWARTSACFDARGDPGNNLLPEIPELLEVVESEAVTDALSAILGPDYLIHPHRRAHDSLPGRQTQSWHKDTYKGRPYQPLHRPEWVMAMVYPQDTPLEAGPTEVLPGSQYYRGDYGVPMKVQSRQWGRAKVTLTVPKGSVALIHYDLWHRALRNTSDPAQRRWMHKLQFVRMAPPTGALPAWQGPTNPIWRDIWSWLGGASLEEAEGTGAAGALTASEEPRRLQAAYRHGQSGGAAQLAELLDAVQQTAVRRTLLYGLIAAREQALPHLIPRLGETGSGHGFDPELSHQATDPIAERHYCAVSALSALGLPAAVPHLIRCALDEAASQAARRLATEGLGRSGLSAASLDALGWLADTDALRPAAMLAVLRLAHAPGGADAIAAHATLDRAIDAAMSDRCRYARAYALATRAVLGRPGCPRATLRRTLAMQRCPITTPARRW